MQNATYACTALKGLNKAGIITPDANGYYEQVLGAFDTFNSAGQYYPFETAKGLFESSSSLMRRIKNGQCYGENGHPKQGNLSMQKYIARILNVDENNTICHFSEFRICKDSVKDEHGKPVVAVIGRVKPSGPLGDSLLESFKNPEENVAFSVRSLTNNVNVNGVLHKNMKHLVTYDRVPEGGISVATKYNCPSLEALEERLDLISPELLSVVENDARSNIALESGGMSIAMVKHNLGWTAVERITAASNAW